MALFLPALFKTAAAFIAKKSVGTAIAKTVASRVVSSAISSKQQKKNLAFQQAQADQNDERHSDRFVDLVDNAQRAGLNPLTALRADGASTYQAPILNAPMSSSTFIGNALVDGMNTGFNYDQQKRDEERDNLERDIMKAQLDQLQKANKVRGGEYFGYGIPNAQTTTDTTLSTGPLSRPVLSGGKNIGSGDSDRFGNRTSGHTFGLDWLPSNMSDAERIEKRYGDAVSWGYGAAVGAADTINTGLHYFDKATRPYNDAMVDYAKEAWKRITTPIPPRLTPSTNPRRPKTFNSRAY